MLESLTVENFTVFEQAEFKFGKNINVFIGENGTGKTHVLKLLYALLFVSDKLNKKTEELEPAEVRTYFLEKFRNIFNIRTTQNLIYCKKINLGSTLRIKYLNGFVSESIFKIPREGKVNWTQTNKIFQESTQLYIPVKEIGSWSSSIRALIKDSKYKLDDTYNDLASSLVSGSYKEDKLKVKDILYESIQDIIGGRIHEDNDGDMSFYSETGLIHPLPLIAEGWQKLAMLSHLLSNGSISKNSILFWDEPESNLNPKLIRQLARILVELSKQEIQIFLATHNLVLLKELDLILEQENLGEGASAFFALSRDDASQPVQVSQGPTLSDVDPIVALDEELEQASLHLKRARQRAL